MTSEKRNAVIYVVAGVLWPGFVALLVIILLVIPDMANSSHPASEPSISDVVLMIWIGSLFWPGVVAGFAKGTRRGKPWNHYDRARWFFWLSFVLSPLTWPFMFNL